MNNNKIILSDKDMEIFINSTMNPAEPNEKLKEAVKKYKQLLENNKGHGIKIGRKSED